MNDALTYVILVSHMQKLYEEKGLGECLKKLQTTNYGTLDANNRNKDSLLSVAKMNFYIISEMIGRCRLGESKANLIALSDHIQEMASYIEEASQLV